MTCPYCGQRAYVGLFTVECSNAKCKHNPDRGRTEFEGWGPKQLTNWGGGWRWRDDDLGVVIERPPDPPRTLYWTGIQPRTATHFMVSWWTTPPDKNEAFALYDRVFDTEAEAVKFVDEVLR